MNHCSMIVQLTQHHIKAHKKIKIETSLSFILMHISQVIMM